ncbi:MAG: UDP binding domain-containing protein, partial [Acidimicrobiales bacterium]
MALGAQVRAVDPHVEHHHILSGVEPVPLSAEEITAADAVILLVDHDDLDYDMVTANATYVLDCRHRVEGPNVEHL